MRPVPCGKHPCEALAAAMLNTERGGEVFDVAHAAETGEIRENPPDRQTPFQFETAPRGPGPRSYDLQIADMTMGFGYTQYKDCKKLRGLLKKYATPTRPLKHIAYHERLWSNDAVPLERSILWAPEPDPSKVRDATFGLFEWRLSYLWHWIELYIHKKEPSSTVVPFRRLIPMRLVGLIQFDFSPEVFERARREGLHWQPTRQDLRQPALVERETLVVLRPPAGQRPRNATAEVTRGLAEFVAEVARLCGPVEEGAAWYIDYRRWRGHRLEFPSTNLPPLEAVLSPAEAAFHLARVGKKSKCSLCTSRHLYAYVEGLGHWWDLCWSCAGQVLHSGARDFVFARYPLTVPPLLRVAPPRCVDGHELVPTGDKTYAAIGPIKVCFNTEEIGADDTVVGVARILYCTS